MDLCPNMDGITPEATSNFVYIREAIGRWVIEQFGIQRPKCESLGLMVFILTKECTNQES